MNISEAEEELAGEELVAVISSSLLYVKELRDRCLQADVPVLIGDMPGKGWGTKARLLVREADIQRFAEVMNSDWAGMVEREGTTATSAAAEVAEDGYPACPACGCTAAPNEGECADCGLMLE